MIDKPFFSVDTKQALNPSIIDYKILSSTEYIVSNAQYLAYNLRENTTAAKNKTESNIHAIAFLHF